MTKEEMELYKKLQAKVKDAKKDSKELVSKVMEPIFTAVNIDDIFNAITLSGGERISKTAKLEDGRKLNLCFRDVTHLGKKDSE